jgi:hypothetical protein
LKTLRERIINALGGVVPEKAGSFTVEATFERGESLRAHGIPGEDDLTDDNGNIWRQPAERGRPVSHL